MVGCNGHRDRRGEGENLWKVLEPKHGRSLSVPMPGPIVGARILSARLIEIDAVADGRKVTHWPGGTEQAP